MAVTVKVSSFKYEVPEDDCADTSYLEQEGFEDRLAAYRRGDFGFVGVRAYVDVLIPFGRAHKIIHRFTTPGLWGIEDDSDRSYFDEVIQEEKGVLAEMLRALGLSVI